MNPKRKKAEEFIYTTLDILDKTEINSSYYKSIFAKMDDTQFYNFCKRDLPIRFQYKPFVTEPKMEDIEKALDFIGVPLLEPISLPYLYENKEKGPVWSQPAMVIYIHTKKMKQFITKKNSMSTNISSRDMKTGLLTGSDKGGKESDREMEALAVMGLENTMKELSTWRADYMNAKSTAYQIINTTGQIHDSDIPISNEDSISKNLVNTYMLGSFLMTNVLNKDYMLPKTIQNRSAKVRREVE